MIADSAPDPAALTNRYRGRIQETLSELKNFAPPCVGCGLFVTGQTAGAGEAMSPSCRATYNDLFKIGRTAQDESASDRTIDIKIAFGYMDFGKYTEDRYASAALFDELMAPCSAGRFACGFKQDPDDADAVFKRITVLGPDGKIRHRQFRLQVHNSSFTDSEAANRTTSAQQQRRKTQEAQAFFDSALKNSDIVFYIGHARDGGGPDFAPPVVSQQLHHADYAWYHAHHPGVNEMNMDLLGAPHSPKILGLFACYAQNHFLNWLRSLAPKTGLILSGQQEFEASLGQAIASLDSILGMRCEEQFNRAVDTITNVNSTVITPVKVDRVFSK